MEAGESPVGMIDPRGGSGAFLQALFGAAVRRLPNRAAETAEGEKLPPTAAAGAACPRCGAQLGVVPGPALPGPRPQRLVGCADCGFVGIQPRPHT